MGELCVRRGQIELLAALFHADAPTGVPTRATFSPIFQRHRRELQAQC